MVTQMIKVPDIEASAATSFIPRWVMIAKNFCFIFSGSIPSSINELVRNKITFEKWQLVFLVSRAVKMGLWLIVSEGLSKDLLLSLLAEILMGVGVQTHWV